MHKIFAHFNCIRHVCFTYTTSLFSNCGKTYLATGSVADLAQRPERRVITALQNIHLKLSYISRRLVAARSMSQTIFGIHGRHISGPRLTYNKSTLLMQNNPRLPHVCLDWPARSLE